MLLIAVVRRIGLDRMGDERSKEPPTRNEEAMLEDRKMGRWKGSTGDYMLSKKTV